MNSIKLIANLLFKKSYFILQTNKSILLNQQFLTRNYSIISNVNKLLDFDKKRCLVSYNEQAARSYAKKSKKDDKSGSVKKPKVQLNNDELNRVINFNDMVSNMNQIVNQLRDDYARHIALRLTTSTIEQIQVKTTDGVFKISELGQVIVKSSNLYLIDMINSPQNIQKVVDAIFKSGLSLNPQIDKTTIFINIPKVTREHRENLAKSAKKYYENAINKLRDLVKKNQRKVTDSKGISDDLIFQTNETIKYQYTIHEKEAQKIRDAKQAELLASD